MTAVQLLENWFELANDRCCEPVTADTVPATCHKCTQIRLCHRSHSSRGSNFVWTATDNQQAVRMCVLQHFKNSLRPTLNVFWPKM